MAKTYHHLNVGEEVQLQLFRWNEDCTATVLETARGIVRQVFKTRIDITYRCRSGDRREPWDKQSFCRTTSQFSLASGLTWGFSGDEGYRIDPSHARAKVRAT